MKFRELQVSGCFLIENDPRADHRGTFVKSFQRSLFLNSPVGRALEFKEDFYSVSKPGVLRGLHFQKPPAAHDKLVFCLRGEIIDVGLDLRKGSPTFGKHFQVALSEAKHEMIFLPAGIAHGFYVPSTSMDSLVYYKVTTEYDPEADAGVRWDSAQITWPDMNPMISDRDKGFGSLQDLGSGIQFI